MSKVRFSTQIPHALQARVRAVVRGMQHLYGPDYTLSQFTTDAMTAHAARLERDHHQGEPFPTTPEQGSSLRAGRRVTPAVTPAVAPAPHRVQLRRTRGWRLPDGVVNVAYPTRWANPYRPADRSPEANAAAVEQYRDYLTGHPDLVAAARAELAGKDLACWCDPALPCHADVLLRVADENRAWRHRAPNNTGG